MTEEKIKEGQKLLDRLSRLKVEKNNWERCNSISELRLEFEKAAGSVRVDDSFINFSDLKLLVISKIQRRIDEVQQQFNNL